MLKICCLVLREGALPPAKSKDILDAGHDLFTPIPFSLLPGERKTIASGLIVWYEAVWQLAEGVSWYPRLAPKSGLASKNGIDVLGGVSDRGYCGPEDELKVVLLNTGLAEVVFTAGTAICQIVPELIALTANMEAELRTECPKSASRGGLGSGIG